MPLQGKRGVLLGQGCRCREREGCSLVRGAVAGKERGAPWSGVPLQGKRGVLLGQGCRCREREGCSLVRGAVAGKERGLLGQGCSCRRAQKGSF